jgi:hypothetical protein
MPLRHYVMQVTGKAGPPLAYSPGPAEQPVKHQPVKLWEAMGPAHLGPPQLARLVESEYRQMPGWVLDVVDYSSAGVVRRTLWRFPE